MRSYDHHGDQPDHPANARSAVVVGLVTEEGLPAAVAACLTDEPPGVLTDQISDEVEWQIHTRCDPLLLDENGLIPLLDLADQHRPVHNNRTC
jgi:hypothetical protein